MDWEGKIRAAQKMVSALCKRKNSLGSREWIMSIPARRDYDPDLVIGDGLRAALACIAELEAELVEARRDKRSTDLEWDDDGIARISEDVHFDVYEDELILMTDGVLFCSDSLIKGVEHGKHDAESAAGALGLLAPKEDG